MKKGIIAVLLAITLASCASYVPGHFTYRGGEYGIEYADGTFYPMPSGDSDGDGD